MEQQVCAAPSRLASGAPRSGEIGRSLRRGWGRLGLGASQGSGRGRGEHVLRQGHQAWVLNSGRSLLMHVVAGARVRRLAAWVARVCAARAWVAVRAMER